MLYVVPDVNDCTMQLACLYYIIMSTLLPLMRQSYTDLHQLLVSCNYMYNTLCTSQLLDPATKTAVLELIGMPSQSLW